LPIFAAIRNGSTELVSYLLDYGVSVNTQGKVPPQDLLYLCFYFQTPIVITALCMIMVIAQYGQSLLCIASACKQAEVMGLLLEKGADVNLCDEVASDIFLFLSSFAIVTLPLEEALCHQAFNCVLCSCRITEPRWTMQCSGL